jgi:hypothetical protein
VSGSPYVKRLELTAGKIRLVEDRDVEPFAKLWSWRTLLVAGS